MKSRKKMYIFLSALIVILIIISIAYAAMSTTLDIQYGNVTQTSQSWAIGFTPVTSITATAGGTSATGRSCGTAKATATTVTVNATTLSKPGDKCIWPLTIANTGTIAASLSSIEFVQPTETGVSCTITENKTMMVCDNIKYKLTTDETGNTLIQKNRTFAANSSLAVYLTAAYVPTDSLVSTEIVHTNIQLKLYFTQK